MATDLDVPDGMQVTSTTSAGEPVLSFYTGRFAAEYTVDDVNELIRALRGWVSENGSPSQRGH